MKKFLLALLVSAAAAVPASARVNILEPWSPGVDFSLPSKQWTHGGNVRWGSGDTSFFEGAYFLSNASIPDWEIEGSAGYLAVDPKGSANGHSGINDLAVGAKYRFPQPLLPSGIDSIAEAGLSLPTGDSDNGLGAGGFGALLGWGVQAPIQLVTGYAHLGARVYSEGRDTRWGSVFTYVVGAKYDWEKEWILSADLRGFNHGRDKINGFRATETVNELYLSPGAEWHPQDLPLQFLGNLLIGISHDAYDLGILAGVKY